MKTGSKQGFYTLASKEALKVLSQAEPGSSDAYDAKEMIKSYCENSHWKEEDKWGDRAFKTVFLPSGLIVGAALITKAAVVSAQKANENVSFSEGFRYRMLEITGTNPQSFFNKEARRNPIGLEELDEMLGLVEEVGEKDSETAKIILEGSVFKRALIAATNHNGQDGQERLGEAVELKEFRDKFERLSDSHGVNPDENKSLRVLDDILAKRGVKEKSREENRKETEIKSNSPGTSVHPIPASEEIRKEAETKEMEEKSNEKRTSLLSKFGVGSKKEEKTKLLQSNGGSGQGPSHV